MDSEGTTDFGDAAISKPATVNITNCAPLRDADGVIVPAWVYFGLVCASALLLGLLVGTCLFVLL